MHSHLVLNGKRYKLAHQDLLPSGARRWEVRARPSQAGDPSTAKTAEWRLTGPNLFSFEDEGEPYLGVDYTTGVDTRWDTYALLGPATTTVDLSTGDTLTKAGPVGMALTNGLHATKYLYVARGREPKKVKISTWTAYDTFGNLAENATDILYTKSAAGTEEISIAMEATTYQVISAIGTDGAADTASANNETKLCRIFGEAPDRIVCMTGQSVHGNALSGAVTMDASAWTAVATLSGPNLTPTGFTLDGDEWVLGYNNGPWMLDIETSNYFPLMPETATSTNNCSQMGVWFPMGVVMPLMRGSRYQRNRNGESMGPERFRLNSSPVQGRMTALAMTDYWLYAAVYDEENDDTYLCAGRPRRPGDPSPNPMSWFVLRSYTDTKIPCALNIDTVDGVLTNPTVVFGHSVTATPTADIMYLTEGRGFFQPDDANYTHTTAGTLFGTEMRRNLGVLKDLESVELHTADCNANQTITLGFVIDGAAAQTLTGSSTYSSGATLNGVIDTNGAQRILFVDNSGVPLSWASGYRIKPQLAFATNTAAASPKALGTLKLHYRERPLEVQEYEFSLVLDEANLAQSTEEQADNLIAEWGAGPILMTEAPDLSTPYVRVTNVQVREIMAPTTGAARVAGTIRVATVTAVKYPTQAGD